MLLICPMLFFILNTLSSGLIFSFFWEERNSPAQRCLPPAISIVLFASRFPVVSRGLSHPSSQSLSCHSASSIKHVLCYTSCLCFYKFFLLYSFLFFSHSPCCIWVSALIYILKYVFYHTLSLFAILSVLRRCKILLRNVV